MTRLSIIIPVYNAEKYLHQCLDSVLSQSLKEIEVICVDDGSTDDSVDILQEYARNDSRVIILQQKNQYAGIARNNGMSAANGDYVTFLDADDYVLDYSYECLYTRAVENDLDWIKCRSVAYDMGKDEFVDNPNYLFSSLLARDFNCVLTPDDNQAYRISVVPWNGIYKRKFLEDHGIRFNSLMCINDRSFYWSVLTNSERYMMTRDYLVVHRVGQKESLVGKRAEHFDCQFSSFEIIADRLKQDGIEEDKARHVIKRELADLRTWYQRLCIDPQYGEGIKRDTKAFVEAYKGCYSDMLEDVYHNQMLSAEYDSQPVPERPELILFHEECNKPKVSVIIPVYNVQDYLHECLDSVCKQTLEEIEIICVDDGSSDLSAAILQEYALIDKRIRILRQNNQFAGAARNAGIRIARGDYLLFLDSDDFFDESLCEKTYRRAQIHDADIVVFGAKIYDMNTHESVKSTSFFRSDMLPAEEVFSRREIPDTLLMLTTPNPWLKLFRRDFVLREGLQFQKIRHSNDIYFSIVAMSVAERITCVNESLVFYRKGRSDNLQSTKDDIPTLFFDAYDDARNELIRRGIYAEVEKGFVERFFASCVHNLNTVNSDEAWIKISGRLFESDIVRDGALDKEIEEYRFPQSIRRLKFARELSEFANIVPRMQSVPEDANPEEQPGAESNTCREQIMKTGIKELYDYFVSELKTDEIQQRKMNNRLKAVSQKTKRHEKELDDIKNSVAFRIGKTIMWLPKKIRKLIYRL